MILLELFWVFFRVGAFTFGGGYAMVPLISDAVLDYGWMTEAEILNFLAMETVIPGPIAI
ncbi:MAG: chromate transporter, partial [Christensenellaceae bacterium]|nr:chromate transporter [Christensenellaceae bacterium]